MCPGRIYRLSLTMALLAVPVEMVSASVRCLPCRGTMLVEGLTMATRDELVKLIQELPEGELNRAHGFLVALLRGGDPWGVLDDDEPETPAEAAAAARAFEETEVVSMESLKRSLGL